MDCPGRLLLVVFVLAMAPGLRAAEGEAPRSRERAVSPRVAGLLAAAVPGYVPPAASGAPPADPGRGAGVGAGGEGRLSPVNGIVRLPDYVVRERKPAKLPEPEEVMSPRALEQVAMQRFLGDEQGLDRALSMITPVHFWRHIPVLGRFPLAIFETNEQRAMRLYREAQIKERWDYLLSPEFKPGPPASPPKK